MIKEKSLWEIASEILMEPHYYGSLDICLDDQADIGEIAENFITKYYTDSSKIKTIRGGFDTESLSVSRKTHIMLTYLLGYWFYLTFRPIQNAIDNITKKHTAKIIPTHTKKKQHQNEKDRFLYVWFLTSLGHDLNYSEENQSLRQHDDLQSYQWPPRKHSCVPREYSKQNIVRYEQWKKTDHGITGGLRLYTELKKLFISKIGVQTKYRSWSPNIPSMDIALASWAIIAHNIFFAKDEKQINEYEAHELHDFIYGRNPSAPFITLENHPFLFLLSLVDTIEVSKRKTDNASIKKILKETKLKFNSVEKILYLPTCSGKDLDTWLRVNMTKNDDSSFEIIF